MWWEGRVCSHVSNLTFYSPNKVTPLVSAATAGTPTIQTDMTKASCK